MSHEAFMQIARYDGLTGLPNRVFFNEVLNKALSYAKRRNKILAILIVDLHSFKKINATLKKIISPVTSTNVATKGAEDEAGSAPNFFKSIGNMLPANEPHSTTPTNEKLTDAARRNQCNP